MTPQLLPGAPEAAQVGSNLLSQRLDALLLLALILSVHGVENV